MANLELARITGRAMLILEAGQRYILEPGQIDLLVGDVCLTISYKNGVATISIDHGDTKLDFEFEDYPEPDDDQIYRDSSMRELERRSEESCRAAGR